MEKKPQEISAVVQEKKQLTKTVFQFTFLVDQPDFSFTPGQYGTVIIDTTTRRQYSFASAPNELPTCTVVIDTTPQGPGSKYFENLKIGDSIRMLAPLGLFVPKDSPRKKIYVATGTGIAPFRSMVRSGYQGSLYWGLRFDEDIYWKEEFDALVGQLTGFEFYLCLSKPSPQWQGLTGHVTEKVMELEKNLQNCDFYLCGNSNMISELEKRLLEAKVPKEQIFLDRFY